MGLLSKLKLPPLPASAAKPGKVTIAGPDAIDGRRTKIALDDDDDDDTVNAATPTTGGKPSPVAAPAPVTTAAPAMPAPVGATPPVAKPTPVAATAAVDTPAPADAPATPPADPGKDAEPKRMRVDIVNRSGFELRLTATVIDDRGHTALDGKPPASIADNGHGSFVARALDDEHPEASGSADYTIMTGDFQTLASVTWRRGASPVGTVRPNAGAFIVRSLRKGDDRFQYVVEAHQGPPPEPEAPMQITIDNRTGCTLMLEKSGLDNKKASFVPAPPATIDGGQKGQFAVVSSDPEFPQTSGFANYRFLIDPPPEGNPSGEFTLNIGWADDGVSLGNIAPESKGLELDFGGGDRNPVFTFTGPQLDFRPPGKASEPTLRFGDKSADGWVEYLQELLNLKGAKLEVDGDFKGATLKAVQAFQRKHKKEGVLEDGIVGDQTWSFLREGAPAKPHGDGRKPHSFVEKGNSARWILQKRMPIYDAAADAAMMQAVSVGDVDQIAKSAVRFRIVGPSGAQKVFERPIGTPFESSKTGQGNRHNIVINGFSGLFGKPDVPGKPAAGDYAVTAYFSAELGGDTFEGVLTIAKS